MNNLETYEKYRNPPKEALKGIGGGRLKGMTDINPMWRIKALTEAFGICGIGWYYNTEKQWIEQYDKQVVAFVNISLYIKVDGEWSMPISGTGGSMLAAVESKGVFVSDECYKMATTDAISVACKQLGIGADIYWDKDKTKYDEKENAVKNAPAAIQYVNEAELKELKELCIMAERTEEYIAEAMKVKSLQNIQSTQFGAVKAGLLKIINTNKEKENFK